MEEHNAQISLLTGMAAADIMLAGRVGLLRTMPRAEAGGGGTGCGRPPRRWACTGRTARRSGEVLARLDPAQPRAAAFVDQAAELMRGAAYTAFDGAPPEQPEHGGVAAAYAHVTAPLRRLADRYATEVCLALHAGRPVPDWARAALPRLPEVMAAHRPDGRRRPAGARRTGRGGAAGAPGGRDLRRRRSSTWTHHPTASPVPAGARRNGGAGRPAGTGPLPGELPLGERVRVRLVTADPAARKVLFELA